MSRYAIPGLYWSAMRHCDIERREQHIPPTKEIEPSGPTWQNIITWVLKNCGHFPEADDKIYAQCNLVAAGNSQSSVSERNNKAEL